MARRVHGRTLVNTSLNSIPHAELARVNKKEKSL